MVIQPKVIKRRINYIALWNYSYSFYS